MKCFRAIRRKNGHLLSADVWKDKENKANDNSFACNFFPPNWLMVTPPKKRHVSIITECVARAYSKHTQIYETVLVAAIAMMLTNDIPQQYEVWDSPDILHHSLFPLLNMALMSHCRLSALGRGGGRGFITPRLYFPLSICCSRVQLWNMYSP